MGVMVETAQAKICMVSGEQSRIAVVWLPEGGMFTYRGLVSTVR